MLEVEPRWRFGVPGGSPPPGPSSPPSLGVPPRRRRPGKKLGRLATEIRVHLAEYLTQRRPSRSRAGWRSSAPRPATSTSRLGFASRGRRRAGNLPPGPRRPPPGVFSSRSLPRVPRTPRPPELVHQPSLGPRAVGFRADDTTGVVGDWPAATFAASASSLRRRLPNLRFRPSPASASSSR